MTDIVTVDEVKKHLNIELTNTTQDDELLGFIESVTDVIEHVTGPVVPRSITEVHDGGVEALVLRRRPVLSVTSVTEDGSAVGVDGYKPSLAAGVLYRSSGRWSGGRCAVTVVYQAGRASTPASIKQAAKELVAFNFRPQQGGNSSVFDADGAAAPEVILGFLVPNRVMQMLTPNDQLDGFA
ncbi:head-tail connector protein [Micromonospora sp. RTP1Z1]|uniref:head-tail connector protein n=1 Tax=Micromonospora sp. RTP1Z1 TaxID=2994043 RepID=UPI0029C94FAF|nr:head-tail connector protein [Micromonospora sp. RTP1Z1]